MHSSENVKQFNSDTPSYKNKQLKNRYGHRVCIVCIANKVIRLRRPDCNKICEFILYGKKKQILNTRDEQQHKY